MATTSRPKTKGSISNAAHSYQFKETAGEVQVHCRCGVVSPKFDVVSENGLMVEWCNEHSGASERRGADFDQIVPIH